MTTASTTTKAPAKKADAKVCFIPECGQGAVRVIEVAVAPGVSTDAPVCGEHFQSLEAAKEEALRVLAEEDPLRRPDLPEPTEAAPFGLCHVCDQPVGVIDDALTLADQIASSSNNEIVLSWWMHLDDKRDQFCHESCRCNERKVTGFERLKTVVAI